MYKTILITTFAFSIFCQGAVASSIDAFNVLSDFEAASDAILVESFDSEVAQATFISFPAFSSTAIPLDSSVPLISNTHSVTEVGRFNLDVDFESDGLPGRLESVVWTFPAPIRAIGFDVIAANANGFGGAQVRIPLNGGLETFVLHDIIDRRGLVTSGFVGFVSAEDFDSIEFTGTPAVGVSDSIGLDNVRIGGVSAVPLPLAFPLLGSALLVLIGLKRLQKNRQ